MTDRDLMKELMLLSGKDDFIVIFKNEYNSDYWAEYYATNKVIVLYVLDESGETYSNEVLIREGIHELAHHLQYHFSDYSVGENKHDEKFMETYTKLLNLYYNGHIPQTTLESLREGGYDIEEDRFYPATDKFSLQVFQMG